MIGMLIPLAIAGAVGVVALARRSKSGGATDVDHGSGDGPDIADAVHPKGAIEVMPLAARVGAPDVWQKTFMLIAYGESRLKTAVGRGQRAGAPPWVDMNIDSREVAGAAKAYARNADWLKGCWPAGAYKFGTGGLFAGIPASEIYALKGTPYACAHPWSVFDPSAAMIYAAWHAHRLQGWSSHEGTVLSMRVGWMNPSAMGKTPDPKKVAKWGDHCEAVGLPRSFLNETLPAWTPAPAAELWGVMGVDNGWLPEAVVA